MTANASTASRLTPAQQNRRSDILVLALAAVALTAGWFVKEAYQYRTTPHTVALDQTDSNAGRATLVLPTAWVATTEPYTSTPEALFAMPVTFQDLGAGSAYKTTLTADLRMLENTPTDTAGTLQLYVDRAVQAHTRDLIGYQLLSEPLTVTVNGAPARVIEYAFVDRPIDAQMRHAPPVVVRGLDYIILKADRVYMITETVDAQLYTTDIERILRNIVDSATLP